MSQENRIARFGTPRTGRSRVVLTNRGESGHDTHPARIQSANRGQRSGACQAIQASRRLRASAGRACAPFGDRRRARGDRRPHPARGDRRLRQRGWQSGPCADGHALAQTRSGWRSARTERASTSPPRPATPWCASTATRPPGRSPSPPGPPAASARRGRGPAPTATGSRARSGWRSAPTGRASTPPRLPSDAVVRLNRNTTTGAISQPAGSAGCISETGAGPAPTAMGSTRPGWRSARTGRASTSPPTGSDAVVRLNRNTTTGRSPSPPGAPAASARRGGPLRQRPCARPPARGGGQPGRKERLRRLVFSNAVVRLNRNTTTGAISQPAGTAGCISESGAGPAPTAMGSAARTVAVSPDGKSVYVASTPPATPWCASTATRPPGRSPSPPGPPAASARRGAGPCADGHALDSARGWRSARTERASTSPRQRRRGAPQPQHDHRGDRPARRDAGCVSETGAGPCANGHALERPVLGGGQPRREERLRRLVRQRRRGALKPGALSGSTPAWISDCSEPSKPLRAVRNSGSSTRPQPTCAGG